MDILERLISGLSIVILSIVFVGFLLSKVYGLGGRKNERGLIRVLAHNPVGHKSGIAIVKIGNEFHAIGISPDNISHITRIEDKATIELMEGYAESDVGGDGLMMWRRKALLSMDTIFSPVRISLSVAKNRLLNLIGISLHKSHQGQ